MGILEVVVLVVLLVPVLVEAYVLGHALNLEEDPLDLYLEVALLDPDRIQILMDHAEEVEGLLDLDPLVLHALVDDLGEVGLVYNHNLVVGVP